MASAPAEPTIRRIALGVLGAVATLAVLVLGWKAMTGGIGDQHSRVEEEHALTLPASATDLNAMGDASFLPLKAIGLDRGASTIFVMDRADLDDYLGQHSWGPAPDRPVIVSEIPANGAYQPSSTPWDASSQPEDVFYTEQPPSAADFTVIELYPMPDQPDRVGVWIYSDWN